MHSSLLLVSQGCCNKVCHTLDGLKQQKCILALFCEVRCPQCQQGHAPSRPPRGASFLASSSFWQLQSLPGLQLPHFNFCLCHIAFSPCISVFTWHFLLRETPVIELGPTILALSQMQRACFQIRSHSQVPGSQDLDIHLGGHNSTVST